MDRAKELEITACLREAVEQAKASYERAKQELDRAIEFHHDLGVPHPDGSLRLRLVARSHVFREYRQALKNFNGFVLDGKLPESE